MSYDTKFRQVALEYWNNGHNQKETAQAFSISPVTLQAWKNRLKQSGTLEKKELNRPWKKIKPEKLIEYIDKHPDAFLKEIAEIFSCSDMAVLKALKRLKYTRKKNHGIQRGE